MTQSHSWSHFPGNDDKAIFIYGWAFISRYQVLSRNIRQKPLEPTSNTTPVQNSFPPTKISSWYRRIEVLILAKLITKEKMATKPVKG